MLEIRWHGRGGQGAKTASDIFANIMFEMGKYVQSFPEFGPERTGAPMKAYNRVSDEKIRINYNIYNPDILVIVDHTLLKNLNILDGLKKNGKILINTSKEQAEKLGIIEKIHNIHEEIEIYIVDANMISKEELGNIYPNIPLMSALANIIDIDKDQFIDIAKNEIKKTFTQKQEVIEGNIKSLERAFGEVVKI